MSNIEILNAFDAVMGELKCARALINDQVRGTNDVKYELVKDFDRAIERGKTAYNELRKIIN